MFTRERVFGAAGTHGPWLGLGALAGAGFCALWWLVVAVELFPGSNAGEVAVPLATADVTAAEHEVAGTVLPQGQTTDVAAPAPAPARIAEHPAAHVEANAESRPPVAAMAGVVAMLSLGTAVAAWVIRAN